jgi:hypothetical protein
MRPSEGPLLHSVHRARCAVAFGVRRRPATVHPCLPNCLHRNAILRPRANPVPRLFNAAFSPAFGLWMCLCQCAGDSSGDSPIGALDSTANQAQACRHRNCYGGSLKLRSAVQSALDDSCSRPDLSPLEFCQKLSWLMPWLRLIAARQFISLVQTFVRSTDDCMFTAYDACCRWRG